MRISPEDRKQIQTLAHQSGLSEGAVEALFVAMQAGNGTAAQFNHPDLGGMGQWLASGMIMIGDFSNHRLKATVAEVCSALAAYLRAQPGSTPQPVSAATWEPMGSSAGWWPREYGAPTASGSQNAMHYAYFAGPRRLAIRIGERVTIYDTGKHQISGVAQQQGQRQDLRFRSQLGEVAVDALTKLQEYYG
jgi:hypothetical protein